MDNSPSFSEKELLLRIASGDRIAFDQLFREMYPALCYVSRQLGIADHIAQDIASESFVHLWNNREKLANIEAPRSYLYASIRNRSLNYLKHTEMAQRHQQNSVVEKKRLVDDDEVMQAIYDQETIRLLQKAVESLPKECAQVVRLSLQGYSTSEISQQLNVSLSAVSNQKTRAIRLLRERLPLTIGLTMTLLLQP